MVIDSTPVLTDLREQLGPDQFGSLLKVNRIDLRHVRRGQSLVVPNDLSNFLALSPFPVKVERLSAITKLVLVAQRIQAFAAYEGGELTRWGPLSTGKKSTPTPSGLFFTNWKALETKSTEGSGWVLKWYVNIDSRRGISFHLYDLPGYPASHSCVRLVEDDARWIYDWTKEWVLSDDSREVIADGTPVLVMDQYLWNAPRPWQHLPENPHVTDVTLEEIDRSLVPVIGEIYERQEAEDLLHPRPNPDSVLAPMCPQ